MRPGSPGGRTTDPHPQTPPRHPPKRPTAPGRPKARPRRSSRQHTTARPRRPEKGSNHEKLPDIRQFPPGRKRMGDRMPDPPCSRAPRGRAPATPGVLQLVAQQPVAELHPPRQNCRATDKACVPQHAPETAISPLPLSADAGLRYSGPLAKTDGHPSVRSRERQNEPSTVFIPGNYGR